MSTFESFGRVVCVVGALDYERPFPWLPYGFLSFHPRGSVWRAACVFDRDDVASLMFDTTKSQWFSAEITDEMWPWVYETGGRPPLIISALEALAVILALKMFYGEDPPKFWWHHPGQITAGMALY